MLRRSEMQTGLQDAKQILFADAAG